MKRKLFVISSLAAVVLVSCMPTVTSVSPAVSPIPTFTALPTATISILPSEVPYTQSGIHIEPYQDVRFQNLSNVNRDLGEALIETLWFDQSTRWTKQDEQVAQNILNLGMNPGLGVTDLHAEGVTGKGVTIAIIDQPLVVDHPEFQGKIVKYHDIGTNQPAGFGSMHGPAVTSLLVGKNIGTAPDADVYFVAVPSWLLDAQHYADALDWIIGENEKLPKEDKIRVVSVSAIPSGMWSEYTNKDAWDAAYQRAMEAGILVLDCTYEHGYTVPCTYDLHDPDNVAKCIPNWAGPINPPQERINIPTRRTTATEDGSEGKLSLSYQYTGQGGLSWTVPYLAGVLAMGWQVNPDLTGFQLLDMLNASSYETSSAAKIIDPKVFVDMIRQTIHE